MQNHHTIQREEKTPSILPYRPYRYMCKTEQDWNKDGHDIQDTCVVNISSKALQKKSYSDYYYIALSILSVASNFKQVIKIQELPNSITKPILFTRTRAAFVATIWQSSFKCIRTNLTQAYTMYLENGVIWGLHLQCFGKNILNMKKHK